MQDILYPSQHRRFMSEVAGRRRYHFHTKLAIASARGGILWVALTRGWTCNPDRVAAFIAATGRR